MKWGMAVHGVHQLDAGDMGCGELLMLLNRTMRSMPKGDMLELLSKDTGSVEDIPAWCQMRGHQLLAMARRDDGTIQFRIQKG